MLIPNTLFRMGGAAVVLTNRAAERPRAKYELGHVVRVHLGADDVAYECVYQREDAKGIIGVELNRDLVKVAGKALVRERRGEGDGVRERARVTRQPRERGWWGRGSAANTRDGGPRQRRGPRERGRRLRKREVRATADPRALHAARTALCAAHATTPAAPPLRPAAPKCTRCIPPVLPARWQASGAWPRCLR